MILGNDWSISVQLTPNKSAKCVKGIKLLKTTDWYGNVRVD